MYELTVFVLIMTRENHDLAFVFSILYRFQGSVLLALSRDSSVSIHRQTFFVNTFFELFCVFFEFLFSARFFPDIVEKTAEHMPRRPITPQSISANYTTPCAIIASATLRKPAMFAPAT